MDRSDKPNSAGNIPAEKPQVADKKAMRYKCVKKCYMGGCIYSPGQESAFIFGIDTNPNFVPVEG